MTLRTVAIAAGLALGLVSGTSQAATITYDAFNDFSGSNPSGVWTYAYYDTMGVYKKLDTFHTPFAGLDAWQNADGSCCGNGTNNNSALIGKNTSGSVLRYETIVLSQNFLVMDPESNKSVDVIFTAPHAGMYHVNSRFDGVDTEARQNNAGHAVNLLVNGVVYPPSSFGFIDGFGSSTGGVADFFLQTGDTLDFRTLTSPNTYAYLSTGFQADISTSPVPLPASAPMFGAALLALAGFSYGMNRWVAPKGRKEAASA